jgi:beta-N-acetylhexosaminidase
MMHRRLLVAASIVLVVSATGAARAATTAPGEPSLRELVGQRFVVAMRGTAPSRALLDRIRRGEVGGVILFGANIESPTQLRSLTTTLQQAAREAGQPRLLVATDQEGGRVRRIRWAGPDQPAVALGRLMPARIRVEGRQVGLALRAAGVNVDLAPVADVPVSGSFLAAEQRVFATSDAAVGAAVTAFARGLADARVAAVAKHFPGIGRATRNTDRSAVEIGASRQALERDLAPFRAAVGAGTPIVMVSNATYPAVDSKPAGWSPRVLGLLRNELEFRGVTITDALDGAAATRGRTLSSVAVLAAQAGVDLLLLTGTEASSAAAFEHVVAVAERGGISRPALLRSYGRIMELKRVYG